LHHLTHRPSTGSAHSTEIHGHRSTFTNDNYLLLYILVPIKSVMPPLGEAGKRSHNVLDLSVRSIDNRIHNSILNTPHQLRRRKCPQFSRAKKWRTFRKTGCYWAEEYTTSQLHRCARAEVNKFLFAYVILFKHVYFRQYFTCLRERIFNYCKLITVKLKLKFEIE